MDSNTLAAVAIVLALLAVLVAPKKTLSVSLVAKHPRGRQLAAQPSQIRLADYELGGSV